MVTLTGSLPLKTAPDLAVVCISAGYVASDHRHLHPIFHREEAARCLLAPCPLQRCVKVTQLWSDEGSLYLCPTRCVTVPYPPRGKQ